MRICTDDGQIVRVFRELGVRGDVILGVRFGVDSRITLLTDRSVDAPDLPSTPESQVAAAPPDRPPR